ncbi:8-oxoguanine DNA glycosylase OGG fold protein [Streptomyces sp. NPDC001595]|uniref:8-oxoguanine DNA glycosylase OGG fold protein n=1 Tax=Streptomyces sp. NPDC001532 TaxID=3154520 RepID=UPI00332A657A
MRFDQSLADKLDAAMFDQLLPQDAVESLTGWLADPARGKRYANGSGPHAIVYTPSKWPAVAPWPAGFADRTTAGPSTVSRADVVTAVRAAGAAENWTEAFVATQVWGYGPTGYGPHRTARTLARPHVDAVLADAVSLLVHEGAIAAYERLSTLHGLGPAFHTKFLYFAGLALPEVRGPLPLILDSVLAGVLRRHATRAGHAAGYDWSEAIANRVWGRGNWTSHRYDVYLRWMHEANDHLTTASKDWRVPPDVLELALFSQAWAPAGHFGGPA